MAVTPAQLKTPAGKIDGASMFPGEVGASLDARLQAYIDEGSDRAADADLAGDALDEATKLWSYYRAFDAVHDRLISTPAMVGIVGEGNTMFTQTQIDAFATKAGDFKTRFDAMIAEDSTIVQPIPSGGVPTSYSF